MLTRRPPLVRMSKVSAPLPPTSATPPPITTSKAVVWISTTLVPSPACTVSLPSMLLLFTVIVSAPLPVCMSTLPEIVLLSMVML